ncbi:unnamed protein product, partial [Iphiclides podalirius]
MKELWAVRALLGRRVCGGDAGGRRAQSDGGQVGALGRLVARRRAAARQRRQQRRRLHLRAPTLFTATARFTHEKRFFSGQV